MLKKWWSPKQERANEEIERKVDDFFTEYFTELIEGKYQDNSAADTFNLDNISIEGILVNKNISLISNVNNENGLSNKRDVTKDIIAYLYNNSKNKFNTHLTDPPSGLKSFIPLVSLDFSGRVLGTEEVKFLASCLRNNTTIETVKLVNCGIDNKGTRYLADALVFHRKITHFSLASNDNITNLGLKTLWSLKENNKVLEELKIYPFPQCVGDKAENIRHEINIYDENIINNYLEGLYTKNIEIQIENKNLAYANYSANERYKNAKKLSDLMTKSFDEIIGKGTLSKIIFLFGSDKSGKTVLGYQLSDTTQEKKFEATPYELDALKSLDPIYDKKIRHKYIKENPNDSDDPNNPNHPYKLVNNFLHDKEPVNIIECLGIIKNSTVVNPIQKILDLYAYWQARMLSKEAKFVLVIRDNLQSDILEDNIKQFTDIFKNSVGLLTPEIQESLKDSISCIVTFATECKTNDQIKNKFDAIKRSLESISMSLMDESQKFIISELTKSIHLFKKAIFQEEFLETLNIKDLIGNNNASPNNVESNNIQTDENVELVQNLDPNARVPISDEQFNILVDNNLVLQGQGHLPQNMPNNNALINNNANDNPLLQGQEYLPQNVQNNNVLADNDNKKWSTLREVYIKPFVTEKDEIILLRILSEITKNNIAVIGEIIAKALLVWKNFIKDPIFSSNKLNLYQELDSEIFRKHYDSLENYLPESLLSESTTPVQKVDKTFFSALTEIQELKNSYNDEPFKMACAFLEIIRKFHNIKENPNNEARIAFQELLGKYVYLLIEQQAVLSFCKQIFPPSRDFDPLKKFAEIAKKVLIDEDLLSKAIVNIKLEPYQNINSIKDSQEKIIYYKEALKWLDIFNTRSFTSKEKSDAIFTINEMKATAHYYLGTLYESNSNFTDNLEEDAIYYLDMTYKSSNWLVDNAKKLYWLLAIREYVEAIKIEIGEYLETRKPEKDYSFVYGDYKTNFASVCNKIGGLLLKIGKFYNQTNESEHAITLIQTAMQYFKISLHSWYVQECEQILTNIFSTRPDEVKDKLQKELCESSGEYYLKLGASFTAFHKFDQARSLAEFDKRCDLHKKTIEVKHVDPKTNVGFYEATCKSGRVEDISILKQLGQEFLDSTKGKLEEIINLPKELQYADPYKIDQPPQPKQPQLPNQQLDWQVLDLPQDEQVQAGRHQSQDSYSDDEEYNLLG